MKIKNIIGFFLIMIVNNLFAVKTIEVNYTLTKQYASATINIVQYDSYNDGCCGTEGFGYCCTPHRTIIERNVIIDPINVTRTVTIEIDDAVEYIDVELDGDAGYSLASLFCCLVKCDISTYCEDNKSSEHGVFDVRYINSMSIPLTI